MKYQLKTKRYGLTMPARASIDSMNIAAASVLVTGGPAQKALTRSMKLALIGRCMKLFQCLKVKVWWLRYSAMLE